MMSFEVFPEERGLVWTEPSFKAHELAALPGAFDLGNGQVGMPHDLDHCIRLAAMGYAVPSPIEYYYDWPRDPTIFEKVFDHQKATAGFLTTNPHAYCLNGIGTMKTVTALWAADFLMQEGAIGPVLIIAPLESIERAWLDTIFFHLRHRKGVVLHGTAEKRRKLFSQPADFYIVNEDGLPIIADMLTKRTDIKLFIIDELADFRNKTKNQQTLKKLIYPAGGAPRPWVWGLTGTPRPKAPTDVFHQCKLVTPLTVPQYFGEFRAMTMTQETPYLWLERKEANDIVYKTMRPAIRYARENCLDLPGEIFSALDVEMSKEQSTHYKELMQQLYTEVQGGKVTAVNEGVLRLKLLQVACGVVYDAEGKSHEIDAGTRVEILLRTIERTNEKVIVFVPFTEVTNMLYREIAKHWSAAIVYGDIPVKERNQIFADFQGRDDPSVLIAHPGCMSRSLTLTEASTIIWYAPIDSNYIYEQANGRITRQGQKYVANIIHLAGSVAERRAYKRLEKRQALQGVLLDMVAAGER
jgi:SNF2 family DNA or RNA helicase